MNWSNIAFRSGDPLLTPSMSRKMQLAHARCIYIQIYIYIHREIVTFNPKAVHNYQQTLERAETNIVTNYASYLRLS